MNYWTWKWKNLLMLVGGGWLAFSLIQYPNIDWLGVIIGFILLCVGIRIGLDSIDLIKNSLLLTFTILLLFGIAAFFIESFFGYFVGFMLLSPFIFVLVFGVLEMIGYLKSKTSSQ